MQSFENTTLSNGINIINRNNPGTPRVTLIAFVDGGNRNEIKPGISDITSRLLLKGTKNRTAEQIAIETDANAIDLDIDVKQDYTRMKITCLNDDLDKAIDIMSDLLQNPTFELFNKETNLLKGELQIELDSPRAKAMDKLIRGMYPDHPYGVVASTMLENIANLTQDDAIKHYNNTFSTCNMSMVAVGDISQQELVKKLESKFTSLKSNKQDPKVLQLKEAAKDLLITTEKEDAAQAQIIRGWYGPSIVSEDYVPLMLLNNILGSAGLSSRLFIELRDKKGLAYSVRSTLEMLKYGSNFTVYIGTEPKNIEIALNGFNEEIEKLVNEPVSDQELEAAKQNILGKRSVFHETNSQQCFYLGMYHILGAGAEYDEKIKDLILATSKQDIQAVAQKFLTRHHITSILAPSKYLVTV
ncbi:MAG: M16 family metallopeptidase [Vampirovibrionia bacterium]